jgi:hypothetical protein
MVSAKWIRKTDCKNNEMERKFIIVQLDEGTTPERETLKSAMRTV